MSESISLEHTKILFLKILFWICVVNVYVSTQ